MSLAHDLVVAGIIAIISAIMQYIGLTLFAPGTALFDVAAGASTLNGQARAEFWYQFFVMWMPLAGYVVAIAWPFVRAYRRQAVTAARPVR